VSVAERLMPITAEPSEPPEKDQPPTDKKV
jgi:hypothetical protein